MQLFFLRIEIGAGKSVDPYMQSKILFEIYLMGQVKNFHSMKVWRGDQVQEIPSM
jgi:hypothetical protein